VTRAQAHEREILEQLAAELTAAPNTQIDAGQIRWAMDEYKARIMRDSSSSRYCVAGRLQGDAGNTGHS
jgi:hypothetical protein